jgi:hypothetical protein
VVHHPRGSVVYLHSVEPPNVQNVQLDPLVSASAKADRAGRPYRHRERSCLKQWHLGVNLPVSSSYGQRGRVADQQLGACGRPGDFQAGAGEVIAGGVEEMSDAAGEKLVDDDLRHFVQQVVDVGKCFGSGSKMTTVAGPG